MKIPKAVIISGPTGVGKTELSLELARYFKAEIVNADSMQVYKGMDIGTAKPTREQRMEIPHHLIDIVNPDEEFNAEKYRRMALSAVSEINRKGKVCLVVGGTGLYIRALLGGLFKTPEKDPSLREALKREAEKEGLRKLYERLRIYDPEYAERIHPNDKIRIIRGLEIIELTGRKVSELIKEHGFKEKKINALKIFLYTDRKILYERINRRCIRMIESGLIEETRRLLFQGYSPSLKPLQSIGYRHTVKYISGEWDLYKMIRKMQADTRRYAKRQITWFKKEEDVVWMNVEEKDKIKRKIEEFLVS